MMRILLALLSGCMLYAAAAAQTPALPTSTSTPEARLIDEIGSHAELMPNLEWLCDDIGARLTGSPQLQAAQQWAMARLRAYGAVGLRDMWGGPRSLFDRHAAIVTREHANLLKRLLARGIVPRVELELKGDFDARPALAHNVVADSPGSAGSDVAGEMVVLGAHLDAWDLGAGAADNGSGVVAMLEVLRAWHALGLRPKRTLRIVLFSGEEQGLLGSRAYVAAYRDELERIQAVLVQDTGSGRVTGFPDMRNEAWYAALTKAVAPAAALGPRDVQYGPAGGSDFEPFVNAGVPAFTALQDERDYRSHTQHSQVDAVDHVDRAGLTQAAQVLAVVAWGLANGGAPALSSSGGSNGGGSGGNGGGNGEVNAWAGLSE